MAELVETHELTDPSQHGWAFDYRIRRDDGEELHAEVRCWDNARRIAERAGNAERSTRSRIEASRLRSRTQSRRNRRRSAEQC